MAFAARNLGKLTPPGTPPERPALILRNGERREVVSYAAFDAMADAAARGLLRRDLVRGDRVGLLTANSVASLALMCGAMRAGLVPVPVNWRFPPETIAYVLANSDARLVAHDAGRVAAVPPEIDHLELDGPAWENFLDPGSFATIEPTPGEPALFLYTSGSTGRPKGVVLSHQAHLWIIEQRLAGAELGDERFLIAAPL